MRRWKLMAVLLASATTAHAADKVLYQPVPGWVKPAPPIDPAKLGDDVPVQVMLDTQQRLEDGQVWAYTETATRAASAEVMSAIGTIQIPWQPAHGDLIVHKLELIRGGERIDLLKGGDPFTVLRREEQLSKRTLDGMLTATLPIQGLRVGDIVHLAASITRRDPTLQGGMQTSAPLVSLPTRVGYARTRLLWPERGEVRWKAYADGVVATPQAVGGYRELVVVQPLAKQPDQPDDAPVRFRKLNFLEASSFADWGSVSRVMAPLYAADGLIPANSPLAAEVAKIRTASADPRVRTAAALQLVQDQVRYLMLGMETGNYVPQAPALTWSTRYGDCKAKTLLLLAILRELGIEAEAVLAHSKLGDMVPSRLPGPGAFDHVLVHATIGGENLWLDGTDTGARLADVHDTPPLGWVLPVRPGGAEPMPIEQRPPARPLLTIAIDYDQRAGITMPAPYRATTVLRGDVVEKVRAAQAQGTRDELRAMAGKMVEQFIGDSATLVDYAIDFDAAAGTATVVSTGVAYPEWSRKDGRLRTGLDFLMTKAKFAPDRARAAWRDIPVWTGPPGLMKLTTVYRLPAGHGFDIDGPVQLSDVLGGDRIDRTVTLADRTLTVVEEARSLGTEIAPADLPAARASFAATKRKLAFVRADSGYPGAPAEVAAARRAGLIDPIARLYARRIVDKPDDDSRLTDRAWFLKRVYDRTAALADMDKAIALEPKVDSYLSRSRLRYDLGQFDKAIADTVAAVALDPGSESAVRRLAWLRADRGDADAAVALMDEKIALGDERRSGYVMTKANAQVLGGHATDAVVTLDEALERSPKDADLLDYRCWVKGIGGVALDTALKDCTRAIELADDSTSALDSRAMVYVKLGKLGEAMADLDAVLGDDPDQSGSLFLRGIARRRAGRTAEGDADIAAAKVIAPQVAREYQRYGVTP